jgi:hypothetical protein
MKTAAQPSLGDPLDPVRLAQLSAPERYRKYLAADLTIDQIEAAEMAVRLVLRQEYGRRSP